MYLVFPKLKLVAWQTKRKQFQRIVHIFTRLSKHQQSVISYGYKKGGWMWRKGMYWAAFVWTRVLQCNKEKERVVTRVPFRLRPIGTVSSTDSCNNCNDRRQKIAKVNDLLIWAEGFSSYLWDQSPNRALLYNRGRLLSLGKRVYRLFVK